jgi:predicted lipoprotein
MTVLARSTLHFLALGIAGSAALTTACADKGAPDTRRELLGTWSTAIIVPGYRKFESEAENLSAALDALCRSPNDDTRRAARDAWSTARETWKEAEVFAFGPYSRPEFRIGPKIDSWPARVQDIEEMIAGDMPVDPPMLALVGVWQKGLPVIEYLLYPENDSESLALSDARRCEYLSSVGTELVSRAQEMADAWAPTGGNFAGQLSGAGRTSTAFRSLSDAFGEVVNRMGFTLENVRRDKLGRPLGDATGGTPAPGSAESRFSGRSIADIQDNLDGIERLFFGDSASDLPGLSRYLTERGRNFDAPMASAIDAARRALEAIDGPLTQAVQTDAASVRAASDRLGELQSVIQVDIIGALGLSLNFNDADGD